MNRLQPRKRRPLGAFLRRYGRVIIGGVIVALVVIMALFSEQLAPNDPYAVNQALAKTAPCDEYPFGTDIYGRCIYSRVVYGARITLIVALVVQTLTIAIGTTLGLLCGYYSKFDNICSRIMEGIAAMPSILLALAISTVLGAGTFNVIFSVTICALPSLVRVIRSEVLSLKEKEFVESEKAAGASDVRIIFGHILPHCTNYLLIRCATGISGTISTMAALSYLGVGLDPTIPNWGAILSDNNSQLMFNSYMCVYPGIVLSLTIFGFTILGEGLRDVLDPKYR